MLLDKKALLAILFVSPFLFGCTKKSDAGSVSAPSTSTSTSASTPPPAPTTLLVDNTSYSTVVFEHGTAGYQMYRIPALLTTAKGTLLAACEARKLATGYDSGEINIVFKRSTDNGLTWSDQQMLFKDSLNTCGNPTLVEDKNTNTIWILMCKNPGNTNEATMIKNNDYKSRTVWISRSTDDGITWSAPQDITSSVKAPNWAWYATGPGTGIQIANGAYAGRLIIPCDHSYIVNDSTHVYGSHIIYSDDDGLTWNLGGSIGPNSNECQVVELNDGKGTLLLNSRYIYQKQYMRGQAISHDGGLTWTKATPMPSLTDPFCEGSTFNYSNKCLIFSNCDTTIRANLTLKSSFDGGLSWKRVYTINSGPSAYSSLSVLPDGSIACLFERGVTYPNDGITFKIFKVTLK